MAETPYQRDMRRLADSAETHARIAQRAENRRLDRETIENAAFIYDWAKRRRARKAAAAAQQAPAQPQATTANAQPAPPAQPVAEPTFSSQAQPQSSTASPKAPPTYAPPVADHTPTPHVVDERPYSVLGLAGFGIAIIAAWVPLIGFNTGMTIAAAVLAYLGLKETRAGTHRGRGWIIAAFVIVGINLLAQGIHLLSLILTFLVGLLPGA